MYQMDFPPEYVYFSTPAAVFFSRSRLRGTQGARVFTTTCVWVPPGFCGVCSGRLNSQNLASNRGGAFHAARAKQDH